MTDQDKKQIVEDWIKLAKTRDPRLLQELLTDNVVWTFPGTSIMGGEAIGRDAIVKRMVNFVTYKVNLEIVNIMCGLEDVSVLLHNTS